MGPKSQKDDLLATRPCAFNVRRKVGLNEVSRIYRIPKTVDGVPTDVVTISKPRFHTSGLQIGWPVGPAGGLEGSIGCVLKRPADNSFFVLSAAHVMLQNSTARVGDPILSSQGFVDATHPLATLADFEPLKPAPFPNRFDAAIALLKTKADIALVIPEIGRLLPTTDDPVRFQSVRKYGSGTLHTLGIVTAYAVDMTISGNDGDYLFDDVIEVTGCGGVFSTGGDSGALVVDALTSQPIGTVIGGAGPRTLLSPIDRILTRFQCVIAQ